MPTYYECGQKGAEMLEERLVLCGNDLVSIVAQDHTLAIGDRKVFNVVAASDGRHLGDICIAKAIYGLGNDYELEIVIKERNKGYGSEAILLIVEYCLGHLGARAVWTRISQNNPRAKSLFKRLGFLYSHTRRKDGNEDEDYLLLPCF